MTGRLRLATLGAGYFSQFHYRAWARLPVDLVAICDLDPQRARSQLELFPDATVYEQVETMLDAERPDVLDIIGPPATHLSTIRAAALRGVNVICQKPFCGDYAAAGQAVALAKAAGTTLIVHENFRFQPWYGVAKETLASASLGEVYGATFRLRPGDGQGAHAYLDRQPYFRTMPRFMIHETGVHYVDVFRYLIGEITAVTARLRRINPAIAGEDAGIVIFEIEGNRNAVLDGNRLSDHPADNRRRTLGEMMVETEGGVLSITGDGTVLLRRHGENVLSPIPFAWQDIDFGGDCVYRTQAAALAALTGDGAVVNSGADYLTNLRIEEAIYASHREGRRVRIDEPGLDLD
ncbi:Gfo/Idh/MocA family protein [Devosia nitrariae]|uniref:NADH-dependent dehydrogenase n=1 Tax=Devosia nitrariae TaxID=2071872 RepID=A0ABQ5W5P5_9HYPH|nr:Gfo/Idh/MocA family oxidoreductase [Devosia nitrariae]GLQ55400.1 NADH-dependent dehydrogenase [Devosia nitrariae]